MEEEVTGRKGQEGGKLRQLRESSPSLAEKPNTSSWEETELREGLSNFFSVFSQRPFWLIAVKVERGAFGPAPPHPQAGSPWQGIQTRGTSGGGLPVTVGREYWIPNVVQNCW